MRVSFDKLPYDSRVWIYQCNRSFTSDELIYIKESAGVFLNNWTAHGQQLQAAIDIRYDRFLVIGLNESFQPVSGWSIDSSVKFIQRLEEKMNVTLLDKMNVTYRLKNKIEYITLKDFKERAYKNLIQYDTIVFNNLVNTKLEYEKMWEVNAYQSWHSRYFN